jgi:hypothetical protein
MSTAACLAQEAQAVFEAADRQNRALTADERTHVEGLLDRAQHHGSYEKKIAELGRNLGGVEFSVSSGSGTATTAGGPGDVFVQSPEYKRIKDPANRGQSWSTGPVAVDGRAGPEGHAARARRRRTRRRARPGRV